MKIADVGPRAVLGHEFGHHVQYEDHLFDSPLTGPEATRRTELMADEKQGHVLTSRTVASQFDAALPSLVAPDAS